MQSKERGTEVVSEPERAEVLLHPLRRRILAAARRPGSSADLARRLELKPQNVNYHVQRLAAHGFLRLVEERRAGNIVEKVYESTAVSYVLATDVLGELSPRAIEAPRGTAARWLALQARAEAELGEVMRRTGAGSTRVPTYALESEFRFETAEQGLVFARAVRELFEAVVTQYTSPLRTESGSSGAGQPYRLILGCYPVPTDETDGEQGETR